MTESFRLNSINKVNLYSQLYLIKTPQKLDTENLIFGGNIFISLLLQILFLYLKNKHLKSTI
ncbi:hypothetical protein HMPREF9378_2206 [Streptococcus sanguinis SK1 = NCTC 7863]|uniref:Uncharacterized protein n=3 Tax=Streptococcus sanguinis TaxID=1305 RepID=F0IQL8_STRSA|nr:hypothetical protein HMPREF9390_2211 [Streptococcus sanguinis SK405]EGD39844.1 hypothetical protein HMPREF9384_0130 [Streptococcus sanguinis SK160]EGF04773.1 hypothetical protein HMPREF9378_2206 [Streptococcus sanguinis SK1 = NCTC 7863]EGF17197.1 hypothetical protein HMPREF9391_2273 [Streptococcus sanguinis SK408]